MLASAQQTESITSSTLHHRQYLCHNYRHVTQDRQTRYAAASSCTVISQPPFIPQAHPSTDSLVYLACIDAAPPLETMVV
jgi:hypothetical protein